MGKILTMIFVLCIVLPSCIGMTGTHIKASIPVFDENGKYLTSVAVDYATDDSKELSGLSIRKTKTGWALVLDKSSSTPNTMMAEAISKLVDKFPNINTIPIQ